MYFRLQKLTRELLPMIGALGPNREMLAKTRLHSTTWRGLKQCDLVPAEGVCMAVHDWGPGYGAAP